jgi:hypothetical protein
MTKPVSYRSADAMKDRNADAMKDRNADAMKALSPLAIRPWPLKPRMRFCALGI